MKKMMFLLPVAAIAMASCSSDNLVEQQQSFAEQAASNGDLVFRPTINGATRGTVVTSATLSAFDVNITGKFQEGAAWAEGAEVKTSPISETLRGSGSTWAFSNLGEGNKYWWNDKTTEATFTAVAPTGELAKAVEQDGKLVLSFTPSFTIADQTDLITAFESGTREDFTAGVPLKFKHALSQVLVNAVNEDNANVKIEVKSMRLKNILSSGNLILPDKAGDAAWSDVMSKLNYTTTDYATAKEVTTSGSIMNNAPMLLIPQDLSANSSAISVLVKITDMSKKVAKKSNSGKYLYLDNGEEKEIEFDAVHEGAESGAANDTYTLWKKADGTVNGSSTYGLDISDADQWTYTVSGESEAKNLIMINPVIFPRIGRGNAAEDYAYIYAPIATVWEMGKKYTYTLNFGVDKYGLVDADQPANTEPSYPGGETDYDPVEGKTDPLNPEEPVVDTPVELFFTTVTVEDWTEGTAETPSMK